MYKITQKYYQYIKQSKSEILGDVWTSKTSPYLTNNRLKFNLLNLFKLN